MRALPLSRMDLADGAPPPPPVTPDVRLVCLPEDLIDRAIAALAPGADVAGSARAIGEIDGAILNPALRLGVFRRQREAMRALIEARSGGTGRS